MQIATNDNTAARPRVQRLYSATQSRTNAVRAALKKSGVKANVRRFNHCIRVVLPTFGQNPDQAEAVRAVMMEQGFSFAGGTSPASQKWEHSWDRHDGRAQFFLYDIR